MQSKSFFTFIFALVGLLHFSCSSSQKDQKPNIIFIMADDLGYADLGSYGQKLIQTPNIDRLADEGMRFTQAYSGSSVCAPARSVLMTGQHTGHTRVRGNFGQGGVRGLGGGQGRVPIRAEDYTVAEMLKEQGYVTGMVGKWGLGEPNTEGEPNLQGFDEFYGFLNQRRAHTYFPDYIWHNTEKIVLDGNENDQGTDYTHDLFAKYTIDFIDRHKDKPFFLYLPFCIPHDRYEIPDLGDYADKDWSEDTRTYAAMVSRLDATIGAISKSLRDSGIDENTLIFFTSDNGPARIADDWEIFDSNGPLRGRKRDPYEGGMRVSMIARYPGKVAAGAVNETAWYFADVLPTLAQLTGATAPENLDGTSILPTLLGQEQDLSDRYMYWEFYERRGWRAVRFGDWKAVQNDMHYKTRPDIELYNLKDDISEEVDLAQQHPELIEKASSYFEKSHVPSEHYTWKELEE